MGRLFFGGIHPAGRKETTRRKPLMLLEAAPKRVFIPLKMSSGSPGIPIVEKGSVVRPGQMIAMADGDYSTNVYSSISGTVEGIQDIPFPWGGTAPMITIVNDNKHQSSTCILSPLKWEKLSQEAILERIQLAGITDMDREAVPAHWKIRNARGRADTLIINAAESDPYASADHRILLERGSQLLSGVQALAKVLGVERCVITVQGDKLNAMEALEERMGRKEGRVELRLLPTRYPLGNEKQIIQAITNREVPPGGSALDVRCVVFNAASAYAVSDAIHKGRPMTHRAITVSGGAVNRPRNLWVPIGTPMKDLIHSAGGFREQPELMLLGGSMSGTLLPDLSAPVISNTDSLLCLTEWDRPEAHTPSPCIRCGKCVEVCPMHLSPVLIQRALRVGNLRQLHRLHPEDCMECGCCSYICPSKIPLVSVVGKAKTFLDEQEVGM